MRRSIPWLAGVLAVAVSAGAGRVSAGEVIIRVAPPAPRNETILVRPGPRHVWVPGYWNWSGRAYAWVPGVWQLPPAHHAHWIPGHYRASHHGWTWIPGHWR